jgi:hypothetical protein
MRLYFDAYFCNVSSNALIKSNDIDFGKKTHLKIHVSGFEMTHGFFVFKYGKIYDMIKILIQTQIGEQL